MYLNHPELVPKHPANLVSPVKKSLETNHSMTEIAGRVAFRVVRLYGTFANYSFTGGKQGVQGARALVRGGSSASNLIEPQHHRASKVCRGLPQEFGVVRLYRTFSTYIFTGETRCAGCAGCRTRVRCGSRAANLLKPSRTTSVQR